MPWPSRTIGALYSKIYSACGTRAFHISLVRDLVRSDLKAKVYLHRLKNLTWAYQSLFHGKGFYRLQSPESCMLISSGRINNLDKVGDKSYSGLISSYATEALKFNGLKSLVLYGSVARGDANENSDVDILGVFDGKPSVDAALDKTARLELEGNLSEQLRYLRGFGIQSGISILPMTEKQFLGHPFVLLDIVSDGVTVIDDGTFASEASKIKWKLDKTGAKRIYIAKDDWYWDLIPKYNSGAEITI